MDITATRTPDGWALVRDTGSHVTIGGVKSWRVKPLLVEALREKNLTLTSDYRVVPKRAPGRPRMFTAEEYAARRREQSKQYSADRRKSDPKKVAEEARAYREATAEKQREYRQRAYQKRKARMAEDEDYRKEFNAYQREWRKTHKEQS